MNTLELYDFMTLSGIFLEIGREFSPSTPDKLLKYIKGTVLKAFSDKFNERIQANMRQVIEDENWRVLPLPANYRIRELSYPMLDYPSEETRRMALRAFNDNTKLYVTCHF
jgi:hypothetical protein